MARFARQSVAPAPDPYPYDVRPLINFATAFQNDWQGVGGNYALIAGQPAFGRSPAQLAAEDARLARMGVKFVSSWVDQSWANPTYPAGSNNWALADMAAWFTRAQALKDLGIIVIPRLGWHFPQNVGALSGAAPITPTVPQEAIYAQWVSEFLHEAINVRGLTNITKAIFFTEPTTAKGTIPGGYAQPWDYYAHIVDVTLAKIVADDAGRTPIRPRVKFIGPGEFSYTANPWLTGVKAATPALDEHSWHTYRGQPKFDPFGWPAVNSADYPTMIAVAGAAVTAASPKPCHADEGGFLTGDTDPSGYLYTADAGFQWITQVDCHMQAGMVSYSPWLIADQPILGAVLQYGTYRWLVDSLATKGAWPAISMHANLTGGGLGTKLYRCIGDTSTLHGTGVFIPFGVKNTVNPAGEYTIVLVNEGAAQDVRVALSGLNLTGRTLYVYTFSGEMPPAAAADPAYLKPWDRRIVDASTEIPTIRVPGKGGAFISTMNTAAPSGSPDNLALTATVTATSTGFGAASNVNKNNPTNVIGARNSWRKATDAAQTLTYIWASSVQIGRVELAFVATTAGVVYATGVDTTSPAPMADYVLEYRDVAGSWVQIVSVTGNALPNRTHTFPQVSATGLRITPTSVAATAALNNMGAYAA